MKRLLVLIIVCLVGTSAMALRADINNDGRVDIADLAILAREWLMSEPAFILTGEGLNPDIRGVLTDAGVYDELPYYTTAIGGHEVWYSSVDERYIISPARGLFGTGHFAPETSNGANVKGDYIGSEPFTGIATISEYIPTAKPKPMRTRRSRMVIR